MATIKKQAAATPPAHPEAGPEQAQPRATHFLDLGNDIYGRIYACLEESKDKQALRHSCAVVHRSPAVNTHLGVVKIPANDARTAEDVVRCLAAFPAHATLKTLELAGGDLKAIMTCALGSSELSAVARENCRNVSRVVLEDLKYHEGFVAALLPSLFPTVRESGVLRFYNCFLRLDFISVLSTQTQLDGLELIKCKLMGDTEDVVNGEGGLLPTLGAFSGLSSLTLSSSGPGSVLDCNRLFDLPRLKVLELVNADLFAFDLLLEQLSSLHTLSLTNVRFPTGVHLASDTVQCLVFGSLSPMFPEVCLFKFPALKYVDFIVLDLSAGLDGFDDAQKVQQVQRLVSWLTKCPLPPESKPPEAGYMRAKCGGAYSTIRGKRAWSSTLTDLMLQALQPLKDKYAGVQRFQAFDWNFTGLATMTRLLSFLKDVKSIRMDKCKFGDAALEGGFLEAVKQLPSLQKLMLEVDRPPRDALAVLAAAQLEGRKMELVLQPVLGNFPCLERLYETEKEWQLLRKSLSSGLEEEGAKVQLHVRGFDFA